jgi:hypothetical protein
MNQTQPQRRTRDSSDKQYKGNSAEMGDYLEDSDDNDIAGAHAFSAAAPTAVDLTDVQSSQEVSAHAAIPRPSANDSPVWLFDTGASRHMSGCLADSTPLAPAKSFIRVAGGIKLPIQGIELVRPRCQLPDGSTTVGVLTKTLYSSGPNNSRLFSWTSVRRQCNLSGKGKIYIVTKYGQPALWAKYMVLQAIKSDATTKTDSSSISSLATGNFASYDEFDQSIRHLVARNPERLYADGHLLPAKHNDFAGDPCNLSRVIWACARSAGL